MPRKKRVPRSKHKNVFEALKSMRAGDMFLSLLWSEPGPGDVIVLVHSITWAGRNPTVNIRCAFQDARAGFTSAYVADEKVLAKRIASGHLLPIVTENYDDRGTSELVNTPV